MVSDSERTKILEMIEDGSITAEEGLTLLSALGESAAPDIADQIENLLEAEAADLGDELPDPFSPVDDDLDEAETAPVDEGPEAFEGEVEVLPPPAAPPDTEDIERWKRWWVIPLWVGAGITVLAGLLMYWAFSASGFGFWFACAWFPFLLGVAVLALAWGSKTSPWLHVRVQQAPGETPQRIAISFPLPVRLTVWGFRMFGHRIPHMEGVNLEEIILALKDVAKEGTPFYVDVDEGENGEKVRVFIG